jgi:monoamine oxidase
MFVNLERVCGRPALIGFVAGKLARTLEAKSDDEFVAVALRTLREMLGTRVADPLAATVVRWSSDPFAGGSYSYVPVGGRESDRDILAAPIGGCLFFCGEATMRNHAGTVHGAYLSGLRAAARLAGTPDSTLPEFERRKLRGLGVKQRSSR